MMRDVEGVGFVICPITGSKESPARVVDAGSYRIARIDRSYLWTTVNIPEGQVLEHAYQSFDAGMLSIAHFDEYVAQAVPILLRELVRAGVEKGKMEGLRLLDYGCGGGHFVAAAQRLGLYAIGMELDSEAVAAAQNRGLNVIGGSLPDDVSYLENELFDVVKVMHVLEHVPKPRSLIESLLSKLVSGGLLVLSVPDQEAFPSRLKILLRKFGVKTGEYGFVQPPIHLHGFSMNTFSVLAESRSLDLISVARTSPLDRSCFPSTREYWHGLRLQKLVYAVGRLIGSGGHLTVVLRKR